MNCSYIIKSKLCKFKATKSLNDIPYCTRHYNKLKTNDNLNIKLNSININQRNEESILKNIPNITNIEYLNEGTYCNVYKIIIDNKTYALKEEKNQQVLYYEYLLLLNTFNNHPNIISLPHSIKSHYIYKKNKYIYLITEYLEETLTDKLSYYKFSIEDIKAIGIQLLNAIKYIHSKKYLYIDLKPDNIMFINKEKNDIKIIDFNLCIKYVNIESKFYSNEKLNSRQGNDIYSSININKGYRGVRIDDIESIFYILLDLIHLNEFLILKSSKQINNIISKKKLLFQKKYEYEFLENFKSEIQLYNIENNITENRAIDYNKFIKFLN